MTAAPSPAKKRSLLRKLLYLAAAAVLLGSLLLSYMQWEANTLNFHETQAPAGCLPGLSGLRILGLSDVIVDIVEPGTTLLENGLKVVTEFKPISARFLANKASYQFKHRQMDIMLEKLRDTLHKQ